MKTKIAFFDIDGTLLGIGEKKPSEKTLEALSRLRKRGVKLCIATGRAPLSLPEFARTFGFDVFMTFNGSFCFDEKKTVFSNPLSPEDIRLVTNNAGRIGRPVSVATRDRFAANGVDDDMRAYYAISRMTIEPSPDFDSLIESEEVFQMMLGARKDEYEELMRGVSHAAVAAWWDRAVDITHQVVARERPWKRFLSITAMTRPNPLPSETETTTLRCSRQPVAGLPWQMPLIS